MDLQSDAHTYTVDRLEDNGWVVLEDEDGQTFNVPVFWLPPDIKEGNVVVVEKLPLLEDFGEEQSTTLDIYIDPEAEQARREHIKDLRSKLNRGPEGDIEL